MMLGRHAAHATGRSCRPEDHPRPKRKRPFAVGPQDICRRGSAGHFNWILSQPWVLVVRSSFVSHPSIHHYTHYTYKNHLKSQMPVESCRKGKHMASMYTKLDHLDPKVKTSRLATSNATNSSCHFGESMALI